MDVAPEIVVLLTDGANTRGVTPSEAAEQAAARGVRVYPIGFGTTNPTQMACTRDQYGSFSVPSTRDLTGAGAGALGGRSFLVVDEPALRNVANKTGGTYFAATDADGLTKVLADLPKHVTVSEQDIDLSAAFGLLAAARPADGPRALDRSPPPPLSRLRAEHAGRREEVGPLQRRWFSRGRTRCPRCPA